ncbi:MAG: RNA polymerase sigma factor [Clostridia bacterium]|nr:RNA polymerase sigma factor [Clostridia bacterium]
MRRPQDKDAFATKYEQYGNMIYKLSLVYLKNPEDCDDILQEVFIRLLRKGLEFKNGEHEKRWIIRITVNCCIDMIRKNDRHNTLPLDENIFKAETPGEQDLAKLVFQLPGKLKAPIHLHYYEGYKVKEISRILEISSSAVKMRLKRGRELLKLQLEEGKYE